MESKTALCCLRVCFAKSEHTCLYRRPLFVLISSIHLFADIKQPTFRRDLSSIDELVVGQCVSGVVRNVTSFGVFVDFGIEKDGLIHQSKLGSASNLGPGDKCDCSVISVDKTRLRVGLKFERLKNSMPMLE